MNAANCPPGVPRADPLAVDHSAQHYAGGANPATVQSSRARASYRVGQTNDPTAGTRTGRRISVSAADTAPPRAFPRRADTIMDDPETVNADPTGGLPGRIPPTAWNGNPAPGSPQTIGQW